MDIEARLLDTLRALPPECQIEILDYAEYIKQRTGNRAGKRPVGLCRGEFTVPDDFDAPLPESIIKDFES